MKKNILIYDTETYGLVESLDNEVDKSESWPGIRQICWQVFDKGGEILKTENHFFDNGISQKKTDSLKMFSQDIEDANLLIAHNFLFDFKVVSAEFLKAGIVNVGFKNKLVYDTMTSNVNLCLLRTKKGFAKYPTLTELHQHLFDEGFEGAHDALNDVKATAKCFWHLRNFEKIDFDSQPTIAEAIKFTSEKLKFDIGEFFGSRMQIGQGYIKAFNANMLYIPFDVAKERNHDEMNPLLVYSSTESEINYLNKLHQLFTNATTQNPKDLIRFLAVKETVEYLKEQNLYFPYKSGKFWVADFEFLFLVKADKRLEKSKESILFMTIAEIILDYDNHKEEYEPLLFKKETSGKGCSVILAIILIIGLTTYFA